MSYQLRTLLALAFAIVLGAGFGVNARAQDGASVSSAGVTISTGGIYVANSYSGGTTVSSGSLMTGSGMISTSGAVNETGGVLTVNGSLNVNSGTLTFALGSSSTSTASAISSGYTAINSVSSAGGLTLNLNGNYLSTGGSFSLDDSGTLVVFDPTTSSVIGAGATPTLTLNNGNLSAVYALNTPYTMTTAEGTTQTLMLYAEGGQAPVPSGMLPAVSPAAVPEPSALLLALVAAGVLFVVRRRLKLGLN